MNCHCERAAEQVLLDDNTMKRCNPLIDCFVPRNDFYSQKHTKNKT